MRRPAPGAAVKPSFISILGPRRSPHPSKSEPPPFSATQPNLDVLKRELVVAQNALCKNYAYILVRTHGGAFRMPYYEIRGWGPPRAAEIVGCRPGDVYIDTTPGAGALYGHTEAGWRRWRIEAEKVGVGGEEGLELHEYDPERELVRSKSTTFSPVLHPFASGYSLGIEALDDGTRGIGWIEDASTARLSFPFERGVVVRAEDLRGAESEALQDLTTPVPSECLGLGFDERDFKPLSPLGGIEMPEMPDECPPSSDEIPIDHEFMLQSLRTDKPISCPHSSLSAGSDSDCTPIEPRLALAISATLGHLTWSTKSFRTKFLPASYPCYIPATRTPRASPRDGLSYEITYREFRGFGDPTVETFTQPGVSLPVAGDVYIDQTPGDYKLYARCLIPSSSESDAPRIGAWKRWFDLGYPFPNLRWSDDDSGALVMHPYVDGYALWVLMGKGPGNWGVGWYRDVEKVLREGREAAIDAMVVGSGLPGDEYVLRDAGRILEYVLTGRLIFPEER
ncbi:hypothetical protein HMN09_01237000 [Mycena chlorophos]|uniref:Uncharacterized protein n=1 Tax=Mycena chlorophos TaxID=658473 RepID=A0A8H6VXH1_MYCCL|nr:hypothetical protein HMN09_01237000 [Mycena chlorophos]